MSYASLVYATKEFLIDKLTFDSKKIDETMCDVTVDGRPPPICGEIFIAVHPGGFRGNNPEILDAFHSLYITLTMRRPKTPFDRVGMKYIVDKTLGLGELAQTIVQYVGMNYDILNIANTRINNDLNKWIEPLRFSSASPPRYVGGEWFQGGVKSDDEGIIQTITFGEARRVQWYTFQPYPTEYSGIIGGEALKDQYNLTDNLIGDYLNPNV